MKLYWTIAWLVECFPESIAEELEQSFENVDKLRDRVDIGMTLGNRKLENRLKSIKNTRLPLDRVNDVLTV